MTGYVIRELTASDHDALLALSRTRDTGSALFTVDRAPDFFAWGRMLGRTSYQGVLRDGELLGCVAVTAQRRYLGSSPVLVHYVHDFRMHPTLTPTRAAADLLARAVAVHGPSARFCFATILDSNPHQRSIVRSAERSVGSARVLGKTAHSGRPLADAEVGPSSREIRELDEREWERCYESLARDRDFASAEPSHWRARDGAYLAAFSNGELDAVAKVVSGDEERRILVGGQPMALGYLAFHFEHPRANERTREAFCGFLRGRTVPFQWIFAGDDARRLDRAPPGGLRFTSTTFAFGSIPDGLELACHELTLI
jgi:hypothetical protein